ncbi:substrate-binding periplasmic protein [Marinobacter sediminum]|uniref:substrate-binding periplasmic protein n=1 Tax=Marinobacter sediminum TaxID=256323 RepID=UPI00202F37B2|nr:transporter substrate-binding domain-containing protein [Marinobacter sediminum]
MGMLLMLLVALPATAQQGTETVEPLTVTVGANHAPPYRILENGQRTGLYVDIFEEISARLGWKVHYREAPFRRVLRMMRLGEVDVMLGPLQTNERKKMMEFVVPAFPPERRLFFYADEANRIERYSDLYGKRIGVLEGASYFSRFDRDEQLTKESAPRYKNLMLMLQKGRVDLVIAPELVGKYTINALDMDVTVSPFFVPGKRSYIAVAKSSPVAAYADDIRAALKLIEMEGIYEDLVLKYMERPAP